MSNQQCKLYYKLNDWTIEDIIFMYTQFDYNILKIAIIYV